MVNLGTRSRTERYVGRRIWARKGSERQVLRESSLSCPAVPISPRELVFHANGGGFPSLNCIKKLKVPSLSCILECGLQEQISQFPPCFPSPLSPFSAEYKYTPRAASFLIFAKTAITRLSAICRCTSRRVRPETVACVPSLNITGSAASDFTIFFNGGAELRSGMTSRNPAAGLRYDF